MADNYANGANSREEEIDLIEVARKLWRNRRLILKVTGVFIVLGILVALFSPVEYSAGSTLVPQSSKKSSVGGGLSGLAAMAGINLSDLSGDEVISPKMYSKILESVPFRKEVMYTPLQFAEYEEPVTLLDYCTDDKYKKAGIGAVIRKYTIGLPGVILEAIRGDRPETEIEIPEGEGGFRIEQFSRKEYACSKQLGNIISLILNEKDNYLELSVNMPEAYVAAQLAERVQNLLQQYITKFKIEKVQSNLYFVQERFEEARREFEKVQEERAAFRDANIHITSNRARTEQEKLDARYTLAQSIYSELAKQVEQAKIQVKETIPILVVVDPVTIPMERSKPKRSLICILFAFLGGCAGIGLVWGLPVVSDLTGDEKWRRWIKE